MQDESVIHEVPLASVPDLVAREIVRGGMTAKLEAAKNALSGGVGKVRVSDIAGVMDEKRGTTVTHTAGERT